MTNNKALRFRRIYKILLSVSIIAAGILLIIGCASIYFSGKGYSREIVANTFSIIYLPICLSIALIIGDIIWEFFSPTTAATKKFNKKADNAQSSPASKKVKITIFIILGVAIISLVLGAIFGGYADVLTKAVNICTECIGLG